MLKTLLAAALFLGICIFGMCFNIIFRKDGKFPETEVSKNKDMRALGIRCMKEEEEDRFGNERQRERSTSCTGTYSDACAGCGFYPGQKTESL